jgi:hypothetical protein
VSGRHFRHVGDRQKCLSFEGCSQQTHLPTLPAKRQSGAGGGHRSHGSRRSVRDSVELGGLHLVELHKMSYYSSKEYSEFLGPKI